MRLINNGYVVQDLNWSIFDQNSYKGVQKFKSWPLRKYNDKGFCLEKMVCISWLF